MQLGEAVGTKIKKAKEVNDDNLSLFMEEMLLYLQDDMHYTNYTQLMNKVKILKNEKKA